MIVPPFGEPIPPEGWAPAGFSAASLTRMSIENHRLSVKLIDLINVIDFTYQLWLVSCLQDIASELFR
jgi:hypothetical protein